MGYVAWILAEKGECYAVFEADLLRWKIIRRNVCTAVALHTRGYCDDFYNLS